MGTLRYHRPPYRIVHPRRDNRSDGIPDIQCSIINPPLDLAKLRHCDDVRQASEPSEVPEEQSQLRLAEPVSWSNQCC